MSEQILLAAFGGFILGVLVQAVRTALELKCGLGSVLKSGGGPGEEQKRKRKSLIKSGGGPGEERGP